MLFRYKPTKFRTHGRLLQSPRSRVRVPKKKLRPGFRTFARPSLVRG